MTQDGTAAPPNALPLPAADEPAEDGDTSGTFRVDRIERPLRLADQVADRLRDRILQGYLTPGTRLRQDQLAAELGVSRTPLRDALRTLQREGLLTVLPNLAVVVVEIDEREAMDIYRIREVIDGLAARLAAEQELTPAMLSALERSVADGIAAAEQADVRAFLLANADFHTRLLEVTGNRYLATQEHGLVRMSSLMLFPRISHGPDRIRDAAIEHQVILAAVVAHDAPRAERLAQEHIAHASRFWLHAPADGAGSAVPTVGQSLRSE